MHINLCARRIRPSGDQTDARAVRGAYDARLLPDRTDCCANWLIWPDIDPSSMSPECSAMRLWVANGGHLFVTVTDTSRQLGFTTRGPMPATRWYSKFSTIRGFTNLRQKRVRSLAMRPPYFNLSRRGRLHAGPWMMRQRHGWWGPMGWVPCIWSH